MQHHVRTDGRTEAIPKSPLNFVRQGTIRDQHPDSKLPTNEYILPDEKKSSQIRNFTIFEKFKIIAVLYKWLDYDRKYQDDLHNNERDTACIQWCS